MIDDRTLLVASCNAAPLLQSVDAPLGPAPQSVDGALETGRTTSSRALPRSVRPLVLSFRNHMPNSTPLQQPSALAVRERLIQRHFVRTLPRSASASGHANAVQYLLELRALVPLPLGHHDGECPSLSFEGEVELRSEPAAAATERFARESTSKNRSPLFPAAPPGPPSPERGAPPPRVGEHAPRIRPRLLCSTRVLQPGPPRPEAPAESAAILLGESTAGAGRGRSARGRSAPEGRAKERPCVIPRECRSGLGDDRDRGARAFQRNPGAAVRCAPIVGRSGLRVTFRDKCIIPDSELPDTP